MVDTRMYALSGLDVSKMDRIYRVFANFPQIERAVLFGSRAMGNHKPASDVDIALYGKDLTLDSVIRLQNALEETTIPYSFDFVLYHRIENAALKDHIDRVGIVIYDTSGGTDGISNATGGSKI